MCLFLTGILSAQQSGNVSSEDGPLPGATVLIKGTNTGTSTDFDGNFTIEANLGDVLVISFVGFTTQEVNVSGQDQINVMLAIEEALEEVVVTGYGTLKRVRLTGSVASVKAEALKELPVTRVDQALQGRLSGVYVQNNTSAPNAETTVRIRGANSISAKNDPLIVVDGFQVGDLQGGGASRRNADDRAFFYGTNNVGSGSQLNLISPNDIASIEVLKDASATAVYGSRGSNGVILITTQNGEQGEPKVTYNSFISSSQVAKKLDLMTPVQYGESLNELRVELGGDPYFTSAEITALRNGGGTDWQDAIFRTGFTQNHHLGISGGTENLSYYISGNLVDTEGVIKNTSYNRLSLRPNFKLKVSDRVKVGLNMFFAREKDQPTVMNDFASGNAGSPIHSSHIWSPSKSIFDAEGNYTLPGGGLGAVTDANPVSLANEPIVDNFSDTSAINANVEFEIIDGLKLTIRGASRIIDVENSNFYNSNPTGGSTASTAQIANRRFLTAQHTDILSYIKTWGSHDLDVTAVFEQQFEKYNQSVAATGDVLSDSASYNNLSLANNPVAPTSAQFEKTLISYMGRINYSFDNKYLVSLTGRSDGSSVFGANNKRAFFPTIGVGWNISNEDFLLNSSAIDYLKIRASYGQVGNQAIFPYQSLAQLQTGSSSQFPIDGSTISAGVNLANASSNPDLKWETTTQANVGLDLDLFQGKVQVVADWYSKSTEDLLLQTILPSQTGYTSQLRNVGEVENKGIELFIGVDPFDGDFKWQSGIQFGKNENKVVALNTGETELLIGDTGLAGFRNNLWLEVGQPLGLIRATQFDGVWKSSEAAQAAEYGYEPGFQKFVDQNGDKKFDDADYVNIGNTIPDFTYGWTNNFSYKSLDLSIFIQGVSGNDVYNLSRVVPETAYTRGATSARMLNRWSPTNEDTDVPSYKGQQAEWHVATTSRWLEDGSYLRVKNVSLGYTLSNSVVDRIGIGSARIYVLGTNLLTVTDYTGYDPEASNGVDTGAGIDIASYPLSKTYTIGLELIF